MKNILTIAKWEITRLRSRFGGKSRYVILPVILLAIILSYTIYHQDFAIGKGLFTIGITSNVPSITDPRFKVITVNTQTGNQMLREKTIDLFVNGDQVLIRKDQRSQYAAGALKKYLESRELSSVAAQYPIDQAFPLRVHISYLNAPENSPGSIAEVLSPDVSEGNPSSSPAISGPDTAMYPGADLNNVSNTENAGKPEDPLSASSSAGDSLSSSDAASSTDSAVQQQLNQLDAGSKLPEFKPQFVAEGEIIVPSLMNPPMPLAQVVIAFLYIIPMFFVSVFFTSSFTEEKVNRKLVILLSAPVSRLQVILGKMLPYYFYSLLAIMAVTIFLHGNMLLALSIFVPVMFFIFSIYLMVALTYRTFKDQTFFSVLALSVITVYLVVPAMFAGVNDLSYISPLTLAVTMYRGESFGLSQYLIGTLPCYLTFFLVMFIGTRVFNEEYLMGFKPLHKKVLEALYLTLNKKHLNISIFSLSILLVPLVFAVQMVSIILASNISSIAILLLVMLGSIILEEVAKSLGILVLIKNKIIHTWWDLFRLAVLSALGFWMSEKLLLLLAMTFASNTALASTMLDINMFNGWLLLIPLALHTISTFIVAILAGRGRKLSYFQGILAASVIHASYNMVILISSGAFR